MATAERASEIEILSHQLMAMWHHVSDFELHRILRKLDTLLKTASLQDTMMIHNLAGIGLARLQQHAQAMERLQAGLTLARQQNDLQMQAAFLGNMGSIHIGMAQHQNALERLLQASDILGEDAWKDIRLLSALSDTLWALGRKEDAVAIFEKAREALNQDNPDELFIMATCAAGCEHYDLAIEWLGRMLAVRFGESGSDLELILRHGEELEIVPALFDAIEYAIGRHEQRKAMEFAPAEGSAEIEAIKLEMLEAWAPARQRALSVVAG